MAKFTGTVSTRCVGSNYDFEFEVDDDLLAKCNDEYEREQIISEALMSIVAEQELIVIDFKAEDE